MNVRKCLEYLQRYERANPNYLWQVSEIADGSAAAVWGVLNNVHTVFNPRSRSCTPVLPAKTAPVPVAKEDKAVGSFDVGATLKNDISCHEFRENKANTQRGQLYSVIHAKQKSGRQSLAMQLRKCNNLPTSAKQATIAADKKSKAAQTTKDRIAFVLAEYPKVREEEEKAVREWLEQLNLGVAKAQESEVLLKNPLRNGVLLCEVGSF